MNTVRLALRSLLKTPSFTLVAVLALALGIGANSAIFSIFNAIFLRSLPYEQPQQIVQLTANAEQGAGGNQMSYPMMLTVRERQQVFSAVATSIPGAFNVTGSGDPEQVLGLIVSHDYFPLLGVQPASGRGFVADDDRDGAPPVVLLSDGYWQLHFAGRADAIGQSITLDGKSYTIIGVMPKSLSGFPLKPFALFTNRPHDVSFLTREQIDNGGLFYTVLARLKPGISIEQARAEMTVVGSAHVLAHSSQADAKTRIAVDFLQETLVGKQRQTYAMLFAAVAAVLLIACANVANLVLARFARRRKETGIRFALGARRGHIVSQFLTESVLLSLAGGSLGLVFAGISLRFLTKLGGNVIPRAEGISLDPTVLVFTLGLSIFTGLALGTIPALQASMRGVNDALKDSSRDSAGSRSRTKFRSGILVTEIAVSFVLLIATSLLISSFVRIHDVSPGFRADGIFTAFVVIPPTQYPPRTEVTANFYSRLYNRLKEIPGAKSVALSDDPPLSGNDNGAPYADAGRPIPPLAEQPLAIRHLISPNQFGVLDIAIKAGRDFSERDTPNSPAVAIINEAMARQLFPGQDPIGQTLVTGMLKKSAQVIGVVADVHTTSLTAPPVPEMYFPVLQRPENFTGILIRTDLDPATLAGSVRAALRDVDAGIPLIGAGTMNAFVEQSMADRRLTMILLVVFASLAVILASLGVYSVMAYSVAQRSDEIGIRMALGARARTVQKMIIGQGMKLALLGIGLGLAAALALTRLMSALLFEVSASEPSIYLAIATLLCAVAAVACWIPSRRAARLDPMRAVRAT